MARVQTSQFQEVAISRAPLLVLDPRDWFASWLGTGIDLPSSPPGTRVPAVIRPTVPLTVTAISTVAGDPSWPFPNGVELVLVATPSGLLAFYGRVQEPGGLLLRMPLGPATCTLQISAPGFAPVELDSVNIPGPDGPTEVQPPFNLVPAPGYPFPTGMQPNGNPAPTLLVGDLVNPDGSGIEGVKVSIANPPNLVPTVSNELGGWILVLDQQTDRTTVAVPSVDVAFGNPVNFIVTGFTFKPGQTNRLGRTSLFGVVRLVSGVPAIGAAVTIAGFPGSSTTRADGTWIFCLGVDQPLSGNRTVTVLVTPPGGSPVSQAFNLKFGTLNSVPVIKV